jgi:hypothetical protein
MYAQLSRSDVSKLFPGYNSIKAKKFLFVANTLAVEDGDQDDSKPLPAPPAKPESFGKLRTFGFPAAFDLDQFRKQAEECRQLAAMMQNVDDKAFWLRLAEEWTKLVEVTDKPLDRQDR